MLTYPDEAAEVMWHFITHDGPDGHGYSQYARLGDGTNETIRLSDDTLVTIANGDRDCSSGAIDCYETIGVSCGGAYYTGNMAECMLNSGNFIEINPWEADNGDILLRDGHTEMVLRGWEGELYQGGFRIAETGTIYGEQGDQTGWESTYSEFDPGAWEQAFRCIAQRDGSTIPTKEETEDDMVCLIQPDGQGRLVYYDGTNVHALHHEDEAEAIRMVYRATHGGREMPTIQLGQMGAPWANRFMNAIQRGEETWPSMV